MTSFVRRQRLRRRTAWAVSLLLAAAVGLGAIHQPCGPAAGTAWDHAASVEKTAHDPQRSSLRVGTFNIHSGQGVDGVCDLERIAECLGGLDLAGLNEVRGAYPWQAGDQAEVLGRRLKLNSLFVPTTFRWWRDDFGNGLLSGLPLESWQRQPLPGTQWKKHRNTLLAKVRFQGSTLHVLVTHVDRILDRQRQLDEVTERFLALPEPAILLGDLNTTADDPHMARLLATPGVHDCVAEGMRISSAEMPKRIDWILARGLQSTSGGILATDASDHPCVWAELKLPPATP